MRMIPDRMGFVLVLAALAGAVFAGLTAFMLSLERRAVANPAIREQMTVDGRARPLAEVAKTVSRLQLVTAEVQTTVTTTISHENWRGLAAATVEAPARLLYGIDVSNVDSRSIGFSPATSTYLVRIPPPTRIATEVCGSDEAFDVYVGWGRFRSMAGEYYLGLARKSLYDRAQELTLSPEDASHIRETTRTQVEQAVRTLVGGAASVSVVFDDDATTDRQANRAAGAGPQ